MWVQQTRNRQIQMIMAASHRSDALAEATTAATHANPHVVVKTGVATLDAIAAAAVMVAPKAAVVVNPTRYWAMAHCQT